MKPFATKILSFTCVSLFWATMSGAAVISVDFFRGGSHDLTGTTLIGVEPVAAEDWNIVNIAGVTDVSIDDDSGNAAASITTVGSPWNGSKSAADTNDNAEMMLSGGRGRNNTTTYNDFITVTGLGSAFTTSGYDVILYWADRNDVASTNGTKEVRLNPVGLTTGNSLFIDPISYTGSFVQATSTDGSTGVIQGNYLRWTGQSGSSFGISLPNGVDSDMVLTGLQVVSIPEPSSFALVGIAGLLGILMLRKRC